MVIIMGQGNYGKIDVVPRVGYVATRFFHLYYVPVIPLGCYIVMHGSESGEEFQGVPTRFRWRSVLAGWVRAALVLSILAGLSVGVLGLFDRPGRQPKPPSAERLIAPWALAAFSTIGLWITYRSSHASYDRALEIGEALGVSPETVERILAGLPEPEPTPKEPPEAEPA